MHFNTKYIFNGDAEKDIINKINYNLDQIISFAVGPDGHGGPIGPQGIFGAAGMRGITGGQGTRGTKWYNQPTDPTNELNEYDLWIDNSTGDGQINYRGATGWNDTGYKLFSSGYFESYSYILGPGGATDKSVIGLKSGIDSNITSLVISDGTLTNQTYNPNKSKVLISTSDSSSYPILTFAKSGNVNIGVPSFYWTTPQNNSASIGFKTSGNFGITALKKITIDSGLAKTILNGNSFTASHRNFSLVGNGNFYFNSNNTVGIGYSFILTSTNLTSNDNLFEHKGPTSITAGTPGSYVLDSSPTTPFLSGGIVTNVNSTANKAFEFNDISGFPVLSAKPSGSYTSGNHGETIFGSTGGISGGTAGPFLYHVRRVKDIRQGSITIPKCFNLNNQIEINNLANVIDLSDVNLWDSDIITITPEPYTEPSNWAVYVKVPVSALTDNLPLYSPAFKNSYKIFLNSSDVSNESTVRSFRGIVFTIDNVTYCRNFTVSSLSGCQYFELNWLGISSTLRLSPRLFYKTCNGVSNFVDFATANVNQGQQVDIKWEFNHIYSTSRTSIATENGPGSMIIRSGSVTKLEQFISSSGTLLGLNAGDNMRVTVLLDPVPSGYSYTGNTRNLEIYKDGVLLILPINNSQLTLVAGSSYKIIASVTYTRTVGYSGTSGGGNRPQV